MFRHGRHLILVCTVLLTGCQSFRSEQSVDGQQFGLAEPDSLIQFPSAVAEYPPDAPASAGATANEVQRVAAVRTTDEANVRHADEPQTGPTSPALADILEQARLAMHEVSAGQQTGEPLQRARSLYEQVLAISPDHAESHHRLAVLADIEGSFEVAEGHYRKALASTPHDAGLISDIGYSYQLQQRPDVAKSFFERALLLEPTHQQAANNLGRLHAEAGDYDEAVKFFNQGSTAENAQLLIAHFFPNGKPPAQVQPTPVPAEVGGPSAPGPASSELPHYEPTPMATSQSAPDSGLSESIEQQAMAAREAIVEAEQKIQGELQGTEPSGRTRTVSLRAKPDQSFPQPTPNYQAPTGQTTKSGLTDTTPIDLTQERPEPVRGTGLPMVVAPEIPARTNSLPVVPPQYPGAIVIDEAPTRTAIRAAEPTRSPVTLPPWAGRPAAEPTGADPQIKPQPGTAAGRLLPHLSRSTSAGLPLITPKQE